MSSALAAAFFAEAAPFTAANAVAADGWREDDCVERVPLRVDAAALFPAAAPCTTFRINVRGVSPSAVDAPRDDADLDFPAERVVAGVGAVHTDQRGYCGV